MWSRGMFRHIIYMNIMGNNPEIAIQAPGTIWLRYTVTEGDGCFMLIKTNKSQNRLLYIKI